MTPKQIYIHIYEINQKNHFFKKTQNAHNMQLLLNETDQREKKKFRKE